MFAVRLRESVACSGEKPGESFYVKLERRIWLPFAPQSGITLGLEVDSNFWNDETQVGRVMWLVTERVFLAEVETVRFQSKADAEHAVEWMLVHGRSVFMGPVAFESREEVIECLAGDPGIAIEVGGKWYTGRPEEVWALAASGVNFTSEEIKGTGDVV